MVAEAAATTHALETQYSYFRKEYSSAKAERFLFGKEKVVLRPNPGKEYHKPIIRIPVEVRISQNRRNKD